MSDVEMRIVSSNNSLRRSNKIGKTPTETTADDDDNNADYDVLVVASGTSENPVVS